MIACTVQASRDRYVCAWERGSGREVRRWPPVDEGVLIGYGYRTLPHRLARYATSSALGLSLCVHGECKFARASRSYTATAVLDAPTLWSPAGRDCSDVSRCGLRWFGTAVSAREDREKRAQLTVGRVRYCDPTLCHPVGITQIEGTQLTGRPRQQLWTLQSRLCARDRADISSCVLAGDHTEAKGGQCRDVALGR